MNGGSGGGNVHPGASRVRTDEQRDNLLLLLGVSVIAACCLCWFLEHLDYLLKPLVFAVGLSLLLRPFVDFVSDARFQEQKLRQWKIKTPWAPRAIVVPRAVGLILALSVVILVSATFIWALYLSEQYITIHWKDKAWNDRFIARVNDLADFTDRIALRLIKKDDFAVKAWHTLQERVELLLKDEAFWTSFANNLFNYGGDTAICLFYVLFLLMPPRTPMRLRSNIVRRIHGAVKKFILIMVALSAARALLVGLLIWACGVPGSLSASIAIVSFWLFFIPNLGSFAATLIPLPLVVLLPDMTYNQRWCAVFIPAMGSFLVGDILGPTVYRKGLDLNEVVILLALVFWFSVWGGVGAVLAVPIMCTVKIVMEEIPHEGTHAVARMMAPALRWPVDDNHDDDDDGNNNNSYDDNAGNNGGGGGGEGRVGESSYQTRGLYPSGWLQWGWNTVRHSQWYAKLAGLDHRRGNYSAVGNDDDDDDEEEHEEEGEEEERGIGGGEGGGDMAAPLLGSATTTAQTTLLTQRRSGYVAPHPGRGGHQ